MPTIYQQQYIAHWHDGFVNYVGSLLGVFAVIKRIILLSQKISDVILEMFRVNQVAFIGSYLKIMVGSWIIIAL